MFGLGASELLIILVIIVLLFGASKIPELGKSVGEGIRSFKDGLRQEDTPPPPSTPRRALDEGRPPPAAASATEAPKDEEKVPRGEG